MMLYRVFILMLALSSLVFADTLQINSAKESYAGENIELNVNLPGTLEDSIWDAYVYFEDSRQIPVYITTVGNSVEPKALGMLPKQFQLRPQYWQQDETVKLTVVICAPNSQEVLATSNCMFHVSADQNVRQGVLPASAQLSFVQEYATTEQQQRYTDYKQFDSRWGSKTMGQYNGTTIKKDGCAMTAAGNIIGWRPDSLNTHLQSNGGYSGNLIIWTKVPGLSYKGTGSISKSPLSQYHVIANVGGHFVLLTASAGGDRYYSNDPGKSSNPVYSSSQIYSTRLYSK